MTQEYSKSFHDFNKWDFSLFSLRAQPRLPLPVQVTEPPRISQLSGTST